jgi:dihydrofolate reductase
MTISLIAAVDEQFGLGNNNSLLCHLPADLQHFKTVTFGKPIIMGRKTFDSIGKPLPGRRNIVLSHKPLVIEGATVLNSLGAALELTRDDQEVMIIGGARVFEETMSIAHRIYLTVIHHQFVADVFFPAVDKGLWDCVSIEERPQDEKNKYDMTFYEYQCITNKFKINEKSS